MRKRQYRINLFNIYLNDGWNGWGFSILQIKSKLKIYSLLDMQFLLPNGAERNVLVFSGDFLFLKSYLLKVYDDLLDASLWSPDSMTPIRKIKLNLLKMIF